MQAPTTKYDTFHRLSMWDSTTSRQCISPTFVRLIDKRVHTGTDCNVESERGACAAAR